jgi:hypothetical protein
MNQEYCKVIVSLALQSAPPSQRCRLLMLWHMALDGLGVTMIRYGKIELQAVRQVCHVGACNKAQRSCIGSRHMHCGDRLHARARLNSFITELGSSTLKETAK